MSFLQNPKPENLEKLSWNAPCMLMKLHRNPPPPLTDTAIETLAYTANTMVSDLDLATSIIVFIALRQRGSLGAILEAVRYPSGALFTKYMVEGILVHALPDWSQKALDAAINWVPHASLFKT